MSPPPREAHCGVHDDRPAHALCQRCGIFYCELCRAPRHKDHCGPCGLRLEQQALQKTDLAALLRTNLKRGLLFVALFVIVPGCLILVGVAIAYGRNSGLNWSGSWDLLLYPLLGLIPILVLAMLIGVLVDLLNARLSRFRRR